MSLLGDLAAYVDSLKRTAGNSLRDLRDDPQGLLSMRAAQLAESLPALPQSVMPGVDSAGLGPMRPTAQDWSIGAAMNAPTMGLLGHTVYHGSPHKFDRFDASKIGTGEGAQAYGHGLYLAEAPEVAKSYQAALSQENIVAGGRVYTPADLAKLPDAQRAAISAGSHQGIEGNLKRAKEMLDEGADPKWVSDFVLYTKQLTGSPLHRQVAGSLYKVDIPDEWLPKMLDWDAPLIDQAPAVQSLAQRLKEQWPSMATDIKRGTIRGGGVYSMMGGASNDAIRAANELRAAGIPGIKYLDRGSRGAGEGTRNYVVFPGMEHLLKILSRE